MGRKSVATIERGVWLLLNKCVMYGVCHLELELNSYDKEVAAALHSDHYNINTQLRFFFTACTSTCTSAQAERRYIRM